MVDFNDTFDWNYYINKNKLTEKNITDKSSALQHWNDIGRKRDFIYRYTKDNIIYYPVHFDHKYDLITNHYCVISNDVTIENKENYFKNDYNLFIVNGNRTKDILILIKTDTNISLSLIEIINKSNNYGVDNNLSTKYNHSLTYIVKLYYLLGQCKINYTFFGLDNFYKPYINHVEYQNNRTFNQIIMVMCYSYYLGNNNLPIQNIADIVNKKIYHTKNILIISKLLKKTGGVQKTSMQLMEILDHKFKVNILAVSIKKKRNSHSQEIIYGMMFQIILLLKKKRWIASLIILIIVISNIL
jgi:hypothetical protein